MMLDAVPEHIVPGRRRLHSKNKGCKNKGCGMAFDYHRAEPPVFVDIIKIRGPGSRVANLRFQIALDGVDEFSGVRPAVEVRERQPLAERPIFIELSS